MRARPAAKVSLDWNRSGMPFGLRTAVIASSNLVKT